LSAGSSMAKKITSGCADCREHQKHPPSLAPISVGVGNHSIQNWWQNRPIPPPLYMSERARARLRTYHCAILCCSTIACAIHVQILRHVSVDHALSVGRESQVDEIKKLERSQQLPAVNDAFFILRSP
jgi:hypothetical protein